MRDVCGVVTDTLARGDRDDSDIDASNVSSTLLVSGVLVMSNKSEILDMFLEKLPLLILSGEELAVTSYW